MAFEPSPVIEPRLIGDIISERIGQFAASPLFQFAEAVAQQVRGVMFQRVPGNANSLGVCLGDSPLEVCVIGYDVYYRTDDAKAMYGVTSRTIRNTRYDTTSEGYHQKASLNMATAVKNVCRHIRAYSPEEVSKATRTTAQHDKQADRSDQGHTVYQLGHNIASGFPTTGLNSPSALDRELAHLVSIGHTFISKAFAAYVTEYLDAMEETRLAASRAPELAMVWVRSTPEGTMYDCVTAVGQMPVRLTEAELPVRVREFMAVLDMLPLNTFTPEVGRKFASNLYYVPWE